MEDISLKQAVEKITEVIRDQNTRNLAVFWDVENVTPSMKSGFIDAFMEYIPSHGRPVLLQAFADWTNPSVNSISERLAEHSFQLIHTPNPRKGKNSSDMNLIAYGIETALKFPWIDVFVLVSGDSDFRPLVQSLRRSGKIVIIICDNKVADSTLLSMADEFRDYRSLIEDYSETEDKATVDIEDQFDTLVHAVASLKAQKQKTTFSNTKVRMLILDPGFNEKNYGFRQFSKFVAEAENRGYVKRVSISGTIHVELPTGYTEPEYREDLLSTMNMLGREIKDPEGWIDAAQIGMKIDQKKYKFKKLKKLLLHAESSGYIETKSEDMKLYARVVRKA